MRLESFDKHRSAIADSLERVGDRWSILILRECFYGLTHFDDFQKRLGIAPNMLTRRLKTMVQEGLLARREYHKRPPRFEYVLTERGRDFRPVLLTLLVWGNRHFAPEGVSVQLIDCTTGRTVEPILIDRISGTPLDNRSRLRLRATDETADALSAFGFESELAAEALTFSTTHCLSKDN